MSTRRSANALRAGSRLFVQYTSTGTVRLVLRCGGIRNLEMSTRMSADALRAESRLCEMGTQRPTLNCFCLSRIRSVKI
jgi:hypothetical protein